MVDQAAFEKYITMCLGIFVDSLSDKDLDVFEAMPQERIYGQLDLLFIRRAGEGELDLFVDFYDDYGTKKAVFVSLHPRMPIMLFDRQQLEERRTNLMRQDIPFEQTEEAIKRWSV